MSFSRFRKAHCQLPSHQILTAFAAALARLGRLVVCRATDAGLPGNKYHALAKRYLPKGAGSVFTFGVEGGYEAGVKVAEGVAIFSLLANIGDTRSLILHPVGILGLDL